MRVLTLVVAAELLPRECLPIVEEIIVGQLLCFGVGAVYYLLNLLFYFTEDLNITKTKRLLLVFGQNPL